MSDCIFCRIAAGTLPCNELLRTETVVAFLDRNPLTRGHALVIPVAHAVLLEELPAQVAADLGQAIHRLVPELRRAVAAPAATVALHNGPEAGQEVTHVHWHLIPRQSGDGGGPVHALFKKRPTVSDGERETLAAAVREALNRPTREG